MNINRQITPYNHTPGRQGNRLQHVILHTMVGSIDGAQNRFFTNGSGAAANYGIALSGEVRQWVSEGDTAWQCGNWPENLISVGIEHEDKGDYDDPVRTDALYQASIDLIVDIARRNGLTGDFIHIHKEFTATGCPDGLDVDRIKRGVAAILSGQAPANIPPKSDQPVQVITDTLEVVSATLMVRTDPHSYELNAAGEKVALDNASVANTPDGNLHAGNIVQITGVVRSEDPYNDGRNLWGRSIHGRFFWLGGTNYYTLHPEAINPTPAPAPSAPVATPADIPDFTPFDATATVTAGIGAHVRTGPGTDYPLNTAHTVNAVLNQADTFHVTGYKYAQDPYGDGRNLWLRSDYGNWVWAANANVSPEIPAQSAAAPVMTPVDPAPAPEPQPVEAPAEPVTEEASDATPVPITNPAPVAPVATRPVDGIKAAAEHVESLLNFDEAEAAYEEIEDKARQIVPKQYKLLNLIGQLVASLIADLGQFRAFVAYRQAKRDSTPDNSGAGASNNIRK